MPSTPQAPHSLIFKNHKPLRTYKQNASNKKSSGGPCSLDPPRKHNKDIGLKLALDWMGWVWISQKSGIEQESPVDSSSKGKPGEEAAQRSVRAANPVPLTTMPECFYYSCGTRGTLRHHLELKDGCLGQHGWRSGSPTNERHASLTEGGQQSLPDS